jgi:pantetheine-phosphate adenylyltransferase
LFDEVIIAVANNSSKNPFFTQAERKAFIAANIHHLPNTRAEAFDGLTVHFALKLGACSIIRGLRALSDFEHEFQMAHMNRHLDSSIETLFLMPSEDSFYTSSRLVKQVARFEKDKLEKFVPPNVLDALKSRI